VTKGYLKPVFSKFDPELGRWIHGYRKPDFDKIVQGYACGNCGEDYMGEWRAVCPVCKSENMGGTDKAPPEWR